MTSAIDALDARLIRALAEAPRAGVLELARRLRVARGTAQSRLDKLQRRGVVTGFGPDLDLPALGYGVLAFTFLDPGWAPRGRGQESNVRWRLSSRCDWMPTCTMLRANSPGSPIR